MGLLLFIFINCALVVLVAGYVRKPATLGQAVRDWIEHPIKNVFLLVWFSSILIAGWGVLSGGRLSWRINTPWGRIESWQLAGIVMFVCLAVLFAYSAYEGHVYRKQLEESSRKSE